MIPIDADALFDALRDNEFQTFCPLDEVDVVIDAAPTLDYAPVRHGEWDDKIVPFCNVCSVCKVFVDRACFPTVRHKGILMPKIGALNYCPNCGAKMDGGKENV